MRERKRTEARDQARDEIGFNVGFFAILMPMSAMFAGVVGVMAQLVTPVEAVISTGLVVLVFVLFVNDQRWAFGGLLGKVLVDATAIAVVWLAPVPVVGTVAYFLGSTIVFWYPIVVLAVVAWLL